MTAREFLVRRWFLLLLGGGVALAWWLPESLRWTDALEPRAIVASALFLMAWTLPSRNLLNVVTRPGPSCWAFAISYGVLPASAWVVGSFLPDDFRIGLMISAAVPCTVASSVLWTRRAGGDDATALLVVLLTTMTSWLITTMWLTLGTGTAVSVDVPAMMLDLLVTLTIPVSAGQLCRLIGPLRVVATRFTRGIGIVTQMLILAILLKTAVSVSDKYHAGGGDTSVGVLLLAAGACLGVHLFALYAGLWSGRVLRFDRPHRIAIAFAGSQKTLPVALLLFERYFRVDYPLAVVPLAFYHVGQLLVDTFIADTLAARRPAEDDVPPLDL